MPVSDVLAPSHPLYLPDGASWPRRLLVAMRAFLVLEKDAKHGIAAPVLNLSMDAEVYGRLAERMAQSDEGRAVLRDRPNLQEGALELERLAALPEGSLGNQLARYYVENGITPFASPYPVQDVQDYLAKRYREVHDVVHVVTGYGTDGIGELELQAFVAGNLGLRHPWVILVLVALLSPPGAPRVWSWFGRARAAYRRGRASKDVALAPYYEHYWSEPLDDVRRQLGL